MIIFIGTNMIFNWNLFKRVEHYYKALIKAMNEKEIPVGSRQETEDMKTYQVSLVVSNIEAKDESDAIKQFEELVGEGTFGRDSYEVECEHQNTEWRDEKGVSYLNCFDCGNVLKTKPHV